MKKFWSMKVNASDAGVGEIYLYSEIASATWWGDEVTPQTFKEDLDALGDIKELRCYINSPGGDVFAGIAIYNMIRRHKAAKKVCYVDGLAASIASVIMCAFDTVVCYENSTVMVHNPWTFMFGGYNAEQLQKMAEDLQAIREPLIASYVSKTGLSRDEVVALMDAETWMDANTCKEKGFANEIEGAKKIAACLRGDVLNVNGQAFDLAKYQYHNRPKVENKAQLPTQTPIVKNELPTATFTVRDDKYIVMVDGKDVGTFAVSDELISVLAAGKTISQKNMDKLQKSCDMMTEMQTMMDDMKSKMDECMGMVEEVMDDGKENDGDPDDGANNKKKDDMMDPNDPDHDPMHEPDGDPDDKKCDPTKGALDALVAKVEELTAKLDAAQASFSNAVTNMHSVENGGNPSSVEDEVVIEPDEHVVDLEGAADEVEIEAETLKQAVKAALTETTAELKAKTDEWRLKNLGKVD